MEAEKGLTTLLAKSEQPCCCVEVTRADPASRHSQAGKSERLANNRYIARRIRAAANAARSYNDWLLQR